MHLKLWNKYHFMVRKTNRHLVRGVGVWEIRIFGYVFHLCRLDKVDYMGYPYDANHKKGWKS